MILTGNICISSQKAKFQKDSQQNIKSMIHTRLEVKLSTSNERENGAEDDIHRPLMHQPVNYPDVRIVCRHEFEIIVVNQNASQL